MRTYYEILQLQPNASDIEILAAFDRQYDYWRRLVNHHDPAKQIEANQELQLLEKIRVALTDPNQRAAYDKQIGAAALTGGLVDPNAARFPRGATPPPPPIGIRPPLPRAGTPWQCAKCGTQNEKGNLHCQTCGNVIGQRCPNCGVIIDIRASFCPQCGENPAEFLQKKELERQARELQLRQAQEEREKQAILAHQAEEARVHQTILGQLDRIQSALNDKKYLVALEALADFQGLGKANPKTASATVWPSSRPEWEQARALNEIALNQQNQLVLTTIPFTAIGYLIVGAIVAPLLFNSNYQYDPGMLALIGAGAGAILGVVGPILYYQKYGGRSGGGQDRFLAILTPLGLAVVIGLGLIVIIIVVVLWIIGAVLSGG